MVSRQEQRERRREEILRAALRLFVRKGYAGTKVGDIAEAVGMSTGLMFHYFESKEALYEELIGLGVGGPMAMMDGGAGGDAIAFFEGAAASILAFLREDPFMADMFVLMGNALMDDAMGGHPGHRRGVGRVSRYAVPGTGMDRRHREEEVGEWIS